MSYSKKVNPSLFQAIDQLEYDSQLTSSPLLLRSLMNVATSDGELYLPSTLAISASHVYLFDVRMFLIQPTLDQSSPVGYYPIDFECQFSIIESDFELSAEAKNSNQAQPGAFTLRLERTNCGSMDFHGNSSSNMMEWQDILKGCMSQRNFHQLFTPIKKLKQGAFASVYMVKRKADGKMFAAKAFSKEGLFTKKNGKVSFGLRQESLINEIKIMRQFDHSKILKLYGIFESVNSIYLICELIEGRQLQEELQARQLSQTEVKTITQQLLQGLKVLADAGVTHRDLKPENIMMRNKDCSDTVIIDFGLSTCQSENQQLFSRCGTPGFIAPEIINNKNGETKCTPISDIFSLGLIFHYMLLGRSIFSSKTQADVFTENKACQFDFDHIDYQRLSKESLNLMKSMLQVNPSERISAEQAMNHPYFMETPMKISPAYDHWCTSKFEHNIDTSASLASSCQPETPRTERPICAVRRSIDSPLDEEILCLKRVKRDPVLHLPNQKFSRFARLRSQFTPELQATL